MNADDITLDLFWVMRKTESDDGCEERTVVCTRTYCHLLMFPGSCTPHIRAPPEMCEERLHNFQNLFKGGEDSPPPMGLCFRQQIDVARVARWSQGRLTVIFWGGRGGSDHRSRRSAGGTIHLYLPLSQACYARTPSLALRGEAGGLADPPGVGVTTPAVQSANAAAQRSSWTWQPRQSGSLSRLWRDSGVSSVPTLSHHDGQAACARRSVLQDSAQLPPHF